MSNFCDLKNDLLRFHCICLIFLYKQPFVVLKFLIRSTATLKIVGQKKKCQIFNQHWITYCPHNYWLKFAQLILGNQFAMWLGKFNCTSVGDP